MTFEELTKERGYFISYEEILEPRKNDVKLRIILNKSENPTDLLIYPHPDSKVTTWQIDFKNYVTYSVIYDDYSLFDETEDYEGEAFGIYQTSKYLEYFQKATHMKPYIANKKLTHYSLACIEHKVDIISLDEPIITEIIEH